eukprot:2942559-Rhodomonas_salina.3
MKRGTHRSARRTRGPGTADAASVPRFSTARYVSIAPSHSTLRQYCASVQYAAPVLRISTVRCVSTAHQYRLRRQIRRWYLRAVGSVEALGRESVGELVAGYSDEYQLSVPSYHAKRDTRTVSDMHSGRVGRSEAVPGITCPAHTAA